MKSSPPLSRSYREGYFASRDGLQLNYRLWLAGNPEQAPLFLILHGFGEHSLRYVPFVDELLDFPYNFAAFDLRGHGRSAGEMVYVERFEDYLADVDSFLDFLAANEKLRVAETVLFGHSMGGEIAAYYALIHPQRLRRLILSSPCLAPESWVPGADRVSDWLGTILPHAVLVNPVKPFLLTHDKYENRQYLADPLIQRKITLRLIREMLRAGRRVLESASEIRLPVAVLMAGADRIVKKNLARRFYERLGSADKRWIEFDGYYHELFRERDRRKVFESLREILSGGGDAGKVHL
ncbi:MAG: lysophospholipase [Candidatus Omnitrophica bacterium]|nr:lysophospholipase [Candidatus Omnitrophota bacterium]